MKQFNKQILEAINKGINLALDDIEDQSSDIQVLSHGLIKSKNYTKEYLDLMNIVVDLGLPSGTLWAKYNLGCDFNLLNKYPENSKPEDWYGNYYMWGETEPSNNYDWGNYKYCEGDDQELTKYCDTVWRCAPGIKPSTLTTLELQDDAAYLNMRIINFNFKFYTPTQKLFEELIKYTEYQDNIKNYKGIQGLNGCILKSKINGNEIFIPTSGCMDGTNKDEDHAKYTFLWTSTYSHDICAKDFLCGGSGGTCVDYNEFVCGFPIRPVFNR